MHWHLLAYGGPDQVMGVASGVATLMGLLMMFWNKILVITGKMLNRFKPHPAAEQPSPMNSGGENHG